MRTLTFNCNECKDIGILYRVTDGVTWAENCKCTELKIMQGRIRFADIPTEFKDIKVAEFKTSLYKLQKSKELAANAKIIAKNYILNFDKLKEKGKGLYFYSNEKGSGKTMLAIAIGNALMNMYKVNVKFVTTIGLLGEIKKTYDKDSQVKESELLNALKMVQVLILDDIGTENQTGWVNEIFYQILNTRMTSNLITLFTSNVHNANLKHDNRIKSRIEKMAVPIQMPEESIRRQQADKENEDIVKELLNIGGG